MELVTWVIQRCQGLLAFESFMWPTPVTINDLFWCRCIHFVEIFSTVPVISLSEFRCVFKVFFFPFISFLSLIFLYWVMFLAILQFERVVDHTCDSKITNVICDSLNCVISLNMFCTILFYHIFFTMLETKKTQCNYLTSFKKGCLCVRQKMIISKVVTHQYKLG